LCKQLKAATYAPGLAHIHAGTRAHLRRDSRTTSAQACEATVFAGRRRALPAGRSAR
jgi:hypothetical protein